MPWWGWLIGACVVLIVIAWVTVAVSAQRAIARQMEADRAADERRRARRPGGGLW